MVKFAFLLYKIFVFLTKIWILILDCHGLVCFYNGIIDLNTCKCKCESYASGKECEYLNCSKLSNKCDYGNDKSLCTIYANVPYECPKFCGLCDRYDEINKFYNSIELLSNIQIQTIKNTQSVSSLGNNSKSSVFIQLIIVSFVLLMIK